MNANAKKWVAALRSGKYKQAKAAIRDGDHFCCLGVACDLYGKANKVKWTGAEDFLGHSDVLPDEVREWLGLTSDEGFYTARNGQSSTLAIRNDAGVKFDRIADIIESEPKGLFA